MFGKKIELNTILICVYSFFASIFYSMSDVLTIMSYNIEEVLIFINDNLWTLTQVFISGGLTAVAMSFCSFYLFRKFDLEHEKINWKDKKVFLPMVLIPFGLYVLDVVLYNVGYTGFLIYQLDVMALLGTTVYYGTLDAFWIHCGLILLFAWVLSKVYHKNKEDFIKIGLYLSVFALFMLQGYEVMVNTLFNGYVALRMFYMYLFVNIYFGKMFIRYGLKNMIIGKCVYFLLYIGVYPLIFSLITLLYSI